MLLHDIVQNDVKLREAHEIITKAEWNGPYVICDKLTAGAEEMA